MGRPRLPQTKEQIAIRLAPGTKARLAALIRSMQQRGIDVPLRSELLRKAIERGIDAMERDLVSDPGVGRGAGVDRGVEPGALSVGHAPPARIRPAPPPPRIPLPSSTRPAREPPPAPIAPPRIPSVSRRGPIPGTLADRTLRQLRDMGGGSSSVSLPELCRRAWPPNPARVHEALRELEATGLVELGAAPAAARASAGDRDLLMEGPSGALIGVVRAR